MTKPSASEHWRKPVCRQDQPQSHHNDSTTTQLSLKIAKHPSVQCNRTEYVKPVNCLENCTTTKRCTARGYDLQQLQGWTQNISVFLQPGRKVTSCLTARYKYSYWTALNESRQWDPVQKSVSTRAQSIWTWHRSLCANPTLLTSWHQSASYWTVLVLIRY